MKKIQLNGGMRKRWRGGLAAADTRSSVYLLTVAVNVTYCEWRHDITSSQMSGAS